MPTLTWPKVTGPEFRVTDAVILIFDEPATIVTELGTEISEFELLKVNVILLWAALQGVNW